MITVHDATPDPVLADVLRQMAERMWRNWDATVHAFPYVTIPQTGTDYNGDGVPDEGPSLQPNGTAVRVNGLILLLFAWVARQFTDATMHARAEEIARFTMTGASDWHGFPLQHDEACQRWAKAMALLYGV
jgi:hypothetical protein